MPLDRALARENLGRAKYLPFHVTKFEFRYNNRNVLGTALAHYRDD
jgi:hypothetical protein